MAELIDVQQIGETKSGYTPQQFHSSLKTFEDLEDTVLYVPFVYSLIQERLKADSSTDLFSHSLAQVLGSHPLILTELTHRVFEPMPPIFLTVDQRIFERAIYITPKEAWDTVAESLKMITAVDRSTNRFYIFRMYEEEISCPLGKYADRKIKVWFCNLYGNKETYYFIKHVDPAMAREVMRLYYAPPIKEFVEMGDHLLGLLQQGTSESAFETFAGVVETGRSPANLFGQSDPVAAAVEPKLLKESQLSAKQLADCYEMIRMYHSVYNSNP